jgi:hypothetical protein
MKTAERTATWRRVRVVLRVSRLTWRLEQAERECARALARREMPVMSGVCSATAARVAVPIGTTVALDRHPCPLMAIRAFRSLDQPASVR